MRREPHVRFRGQVEETDRLNDRHCALTRPLHAEPRSDDPSTATEEPRSTELAASWPATNSFVDRRPPTRLTPSSVPTAKSSPMMS